MQNTCDFTGLYHFEVIIHLMFFGIIKYLYHKFLKFFENFEILWKCWILFKNFEISKFSLIDDKVRVFRINKTFIQSGRGTKNLRSLISFAIMNISEQCHIEGKAQDVRCDEKSISTEKHINDSMCIEYLVGWHNTYLFSI
jgi:hypothetical protein